MWRVRKQTLGGRGRGLPGRCKGPTVECVLSGSWKDNVFWPRGQRGVDVCDKALSSFSCNIPSCLSSLAFIHPLFIQESTDEFHYPVAGTMLDMDTTVSMSTDSGPKDVIGKEKRMPGCYGVTEGKLSSLPWITRMRMRRKNFKPKKTYVHRFRGKGMLGKARNLENSWRLPE